jgi:GntR family transcriptional regulator, transcriptional repressor for pyruvate dehydrogenase complex
MFEPVSNGRVSAEIADRIKAAIRAGALAPGDQLPPERDLTRQLGVSRVSVRDALRMLEANGLIEVRVGARGGAFVTAPAPKLVGEGLADMLMLAAVDAAQVTELRTIFELGLLELACERATEEDLAELHEICDRADAAGTYDPGISADFHVQLARCTHNDALALFAEALRTPLASSLQAARAADPDAGRIGALEHRAIAAAVGARDAAAARRIMAEHLGRTALRVGSSA